MASSRGMLVTVGQVELGLGRHSQAASGGQGPGRQRALTHVGLQMWAQAGSQAWSVRPCMVSVDDPQSWYLVRPIASLRAPLLSPELSLVS